MRARSALFIPASLILAGCGAHSQTVIDQSVKLAVAFPAGATYRYVIHSSSSLKSAQPGMAMSMTMDTTMRETYQVLSVDSSGVASVKVTIDEITGRMGQSSLPIPASLPSFTVQISRDGSTAGPGADPLGALGGGLPFALPGPLGGIVPALPDKAVKPGDRWTKQMDLPMPAGVGTGHITWDSQLLRFDSLNGTRVAVIDGRFTSPMNVTLDMTKLAQGALGSSPPAGLPTPPPGFTPPPGVPGSYLPPGFNPVIQLQGTTSGTMTSWVDPSNGRLVKGTGSSSSTVTETMQGLPPPASNGIGIGAGSNQMTETQKLEVSS